ncbi:hypothetical protein CISIN_1g0304282mg, partial [Citrus sinensis]
IEGVTPGPN